MTGKKRIVNVSFVMGIISLISYIAHPATEPAVLAEQDKSHSVGEVNGSEHDLAEKENVKHELSHAKVVKLTDQFMDMILQETDEANKVIHFDTKQAVLKEFENITTKDVASDYVQFYFHEASDGLYLKPTETPPWFHENHDYDMIRKDAGTVEVVQKNTTDLYGTYTVSIEFSWDNDQWSITNINHSNKSAKDESS
ncbi:hypothetical protein [Lentibacillus salinarum]|uniref:DUF3993 domain-containing protein n=1 Tax=Lentibacillus salinarum TaxID=446820 RepID=A0ABW3ZSV3_9BACI